MKMSKEEQELWDQFFCEITGWTIHPGFNRENAKQPTIEECADMADKMIITRRERNGEIRNENV